MFAIACALDTLCLRWRHSLSGSSAAQTSVRRMPAACTSRPVTTHAFISNSALDGRTSGSFCRQALTKATRLADQRSGSLNVGGGLLGMRKMARSGCRLE